MTQRIKRFIGLIALTFLQGSIAQANITKETLDNNVQTFMTTQPIKAIVYGLWIDGRPVSIKAIGKSMTDVPATTDMHFRIGGVTETLLTTLLMQLVEKKKLSLDDKVARWYPDLPNANSVTLKMLANGTSGYPDYVFNKKFIDDLVNAPFDHWSDKKIIEYAFMEPQRFAPGASQHYSHTDYVLLGNIISQVSKQDLSKLLRSFILKPLSMKHTRFSLTPSIPAPVLHSYTKDRGFYEESTFWNPSWTSSSGSMTSTIRDLGRWANAWMNGALLTDASTKQLRAPETVGKGHNTETLYFAMGFAIANHWLFQNPSFGGYSGIFAVLPEKKLVFIAFTTLKSEEKNNGHLGIKLWKGLAPELAPEYPLPKI